MSVKPTDGGAAAAPSQQARAKQLPDDAIDCALGFLNRSDLLRAELVCRQWRARVNTQDQALWRAIYERQFYIPQAPAQQAAPAAAPHPLERAAADPQPAAAPAFINYRNAVFTHPEAFGPREWERYFGVQIQNAPPFPEAGYQLLASPSRYFEGQTVGQTSVLFLMPSRFNDKPFDISILARLIETPQGGGHKTWLARSTKGYEDRFQFDAYDLRHFPIADRPYWVIMTRACVPGTVNERFETQEARIHSAAGNQVSNASEVVVGALVTYARSGVRLFQEEGVRCAPIEGHVDAFHANWTIQMTVGPFGDFFEIAGATRYSSPIRIGGLRIGITTYGPFKEQNIGTVAVRRL